MEWSQMLQADTGTMSWTGLLAAVIVVLLALGVLVARVWPRYPSGKWMSLEDALEAMENWPKMSPQEGSRLKQVMLGVLAAVASLGVALTRHTWHRRDSMHDHD